MKHTAKRIFVLFLALVMALSLAACSDSKDGGGNDKDDDRVTPVVKSPKDDPAGYLAMAMENTVNEVKDRYKGSPLAAIAGVLDTSGTVAISGELDTDEGYAAIDDLSLAYDLEKKAFLLNLDMTSAGIELTGGACLSPDFVGISFPLLTGKDDYYGIKPRDLTKQLKSSFLWEAIQDEVSTEELEQMDQMLDLMWDSEFIDVDKLMNEAQSLGTDFIKGLDPDYEEGTVELDGKDVDGYVFTATVDSNDLAGMMEKIYDIVLDMPIWDTLVEMSKIYGEELDKNELAAMVDEALDEIRREDLRLDVTYYVADQKVVSVSIYERESRTDITLDYFDGGDITGTVETERVDFEFASHVSDRNGYTHEISITSDGETMTVAAKWDGSKLSLDVNIPYEEPMSLTCGLKTTKKGFELSDLVYDDGYSYDHLELPLTLTYTAGGSVSMPRNTNNLLTLNEDELRELITGMGDLIGGMTDSDW